MSSGSLSPAPYFTGLDNSGNPLSGGLLYTYAAGTTTPLATYADSGLVTPLSNPIVLDSAGRAVIYLTNTSYKFILKTAGGTTLETVDPVTSVGAANSGLVGAAIGEVFVFGGDPTSPITSTTYPTGATYDKCHAGTALFNLDSGSLASGTYVIEAMGLVASAATITVAIVNVTDGSPDTPLATLTLTSTTGDRAQSGSITFAGAGSAKNYGIKVKISTSSGEVWAVRLVRTV